MKKLFFLHQQMRKLQIKPNYKHQKRVVDASLFGSLVFICLFAIPQAFMYLVWGLLRIGDLIFANTFTYILLWMFMYTLQFAFAGLLLSSRFNLLNEYLRYLLREFIIRKKNNKIQFQQFIV